MDKIYNNMYKTLTMKNPRIYNEEKFRTPLMQERAVNVWVDRIGWRQADVSRPSRFRVLGQYAAVAVEAGEGTLETVAYGSHPVNSGDVILLHPRVATLYYSRAGWDTRWVVWNGPEAVVLEEVSGLGPEKPVVRGGAASVSAAWRRLDPLMERQSPDAVLGRKIALLDLIRGLSAYRLGEGAGGSPGFLAAALRELSRGGTLHEPVAQVAQRLHMSPAHFRRVFKAHMGTSPKAFQATQRVTNAKALLAAGRSIKETADELGFSDVFHFMRVFRKITGQTAGRFAADVGRGRTARS